MAKALYTIGFAVCVTALLILSVVMSGGTFNQKCRAAGYSGAALERCIARASDGGPVFEENIGRMPHDQ